MTQEVFICHSSADAAVAREICDRLEGSGVGCWIAPRDPLPGIPWGQQIVNAIAAARVVLLVFSPHANDSQPVLNEVELAANRRKVILPVRIADVAPSVSLEFYLRAIHWFDAATRPLDDAWPQLIADVQSLVAPPPSEAAAQDSQLGAAPRAPNNLPSQVTTFVGREQSMAEIEGLLQSNRLVTIVGSGGAGKTRTAIQVGSTLLNGFPDGVWLVELAPVSNGSLVAGTIARVLGVRESTDRPTLDALLEELRRRRTLLVIDNCEHVIDDVRIVANAILRTCPAVEILATSRESLNIAGERVFRLPSLAVPPAGEAVSAASAARYGAVTLFADRAIASDGRFTLTDANLQPVAEICRRLDGIPLAIELAAARIKVLSPQQLLARLNERFRVLTGGDRSALPRHQTMRALIDWSYDLLSEQERALFRKLSIFADGFTLGGATAVCGDEGCDEIAVLDLLSSLVDKSLLQTDPGAEERYRLLESTRQYAREKLMETGQFEETARRHLVYLAELFNKAGAEYETTYSGGAVMPLAVELEDARNALDWGAREHAVNDATDLFVATRLWDFLGLHREGIERASRFLSLVGETDFVRRARLWEHMSFSAIWIGHSGTAKDAADHAMADAQRSQMPSVLADCLQLSAEVMARDGSFDEAWAALDAAEALSLSPRQKARALHERGRIAQLRGDLQTASRYNTEVRDLYVLLGNDVGAVSAALNLAEIEHARGATSDAVKIVAQELPRAERLPDRGMWAHLTENLAGYLASVGDVGGARRAALAAIAFYSSSDAAGPFAAIALEHLALALAIGGDFGPAAIFEGYVEHTLAELRFEREYTERTSHDRLLQILKANLSAEELSEHMACGAGMPAREALANAERLEVMT